VAITEEEEDVSPDQTDFHIYEEPETGGNLCAKLMFFTLFSSLIVLIALVAINYQGDFQSKQINRHHFQSDWLICNKFQRTLFKRNRDMQSTLITWTK